jgi:putative transposase
MDTYTSADDIAKEVKRLLSEGKIKQGEFPKDREKVHAYCQRHNVPFKEVKAKGGPKGVKKLYRVAIIPNLPSAVRAALGCDAVSKAAKIGARVAEEKVVEATRTIEEQQKHKEECLVKFNALPEERKTAALAKQEVLKACAEFLKGGGYKGRMKGGKSTWSMEGVNDFVAEAMARGSKLLPDWVIEELKRKGDISASYRTLIRWRDGYEADGLWGLADKYVGRDTSTLTKKHKDFVEACLVNHPAISMTKIHSGMEARFKGEEIPKIGAINRYVNKWKDENAALWLYLTNPDEWKNKYMFAVGNASEEVVRLNQRWEADSTPGDIMFIDGRHTVIGVIDVWPRRVRFLVSPTSKAAAIAALFRRCFMEWGVPEVIKTDNGSDYTSIYLDAVLKDLNIEHPLCKPFTPEEKPHIERALGTMSHGIVELLPGYIGHSVGDRKAIEARRTFAHRLMKKGEVVEVKLTSTEFQKILDRWTDAMYMHDTHQGLDGKTPAQMVRSWTEPVRKIGHERALDLLLQPAPERGGWRQITKEGVRITYGAAVLNYAAVEFSAFAGERIQVKPDLADLGRAAIYLESGAFLCWAEDPTWYGISRAEAATHLKAKQKKVMQEGVEELKKKARALKTKGLAMEILEHREELLRAESANVIEMPKRTTEYNTPALEEAARALEILENGPVPAPAKPTTEQMEMKAQIKEELQRRQSTNVVGLVQETARQRYKRWKGLKEELRCGVTIAEEDYGFVASYEKSAECQAFLMVEADLGTMSK